MKSELTPSSDKVKWLQDLKLRARLDEKTFVKAIASCGKGPGWHRALHLLDVMDENRLEARAAAYTAAMWACSGDGPHEAQRRRAALQLYKQMQMWGIRPYDGTCAALAACAGLDDWPWALERVSQMRADGLARLPRAHITAASVCESVAASWTMSLELLQQACQSANILREGPPELPDALPTQMSAFSRGRHWSLAISAHEKARRQQQGITLSTYNKLIKACSLQSENWRHVLALLGEICDEDLVPDADSYEAAVHCCGDASEWAWVVQLYEELILYNLPQQQVHAVATHACQILGDEKRIRALAKTAEAVTEHAGCVHHA